MTGTDQSVIEESGYDEAVQGKWITIGYEECGAGEPLVLLMGLGAPGSKWAPHMAAYEKYFHCYALDNRGAGHSDKPVLLKLRKSIEQERTEQNLSALQRLVDAGIMEGIKENLEAGNITEYDYVRLARYTKMLYDHLYSGYEEMEELNSMMDESFMTDVDIMIRDIERLEEKVEEIEKQKEEAENQKTEFERQKKTAEEALVRKDSEIAELKRQLEQMRACR